MYTALIQKRECASVQYGRTEYMTNNATKEVQKMANKITAKIEKGELHIAIPCTTKNCPLSKTGKTRRVASTEGNVELDGVEVEGKTVKLGLNAYISA